MFARYGLADLPRVSDPSGALYAAFGLERGRLMQVIGPSVWLRGAVALAKGHLAGIPAVDTLRMPGVFLVHHGDLVRAFRHELASDVPDYLALSSCPIPGSEGG
jgi:hypothetical protein